MKQINRVASMMSLAKRFRNLGKKIAFVPTMGYLHEGHLSLVKLARKYADIVVMSIYVNPTQFGPNEDFAKYPRNLSRDKKMAQSAGVDFLFTPSTDDIYGMSEIPLWKDTKKLSKKLCGKSRPTHFAGVVNVVTRLFKVANPHVAIFGEKDFQQLSIIKIMSQELDLGVKIIGAPTSRSKDGLALSSRNQYLSDHEKKLALVLSQTLKLAKKTSLKINDSPTILRLCKKNLALYPEIKLDYLQLVEANTLKNAKKIRRGKMRLLIAAKIGATRLIDNLRL